MIAEFNTCRACDNIFDVAKEPLCTNCATTIIQERDELEIENKFLKVRVAELEALLTNDEDAYEAAIDTRKALEAGGESSND